MVWFALLAACGVGAPDVAEEAVLTSTPPGAWVVLDGEHVGDTPWTAPAARLPVTVTLKANGYRSSDVELDGPEDVTLQPGCERLVAYDGRFASQSELSPAELALLPSEKLPFLRNEVFAQYGRPFTKAAFAEHFSATDWYEENAHFDEGALTETDRANIALIKSFEGKGAKAARRILDQSQFDGGGRVLSFVDASHMEVSQPGGDIYEWERKQRFWMARGQWVITWESPETFSASARKARLWKLDLDGGRVVESMPLRPPRG